MAIDGGSVTASFEPGSLRVDGVMKRGRLDPRGLSARDYAKIEATIRDDVLDTRRHPTAEVTGSLVETGDGVELDGTLTLVGRTTPLPRIRTSTRADVWRVEVDLAPSRWGVAPYRALGGTLRLQDRARLELELPRIDDVLTTQHRWESP